MIEMLGHTITFLPNYFMYIKSIDDMMKKSNLIQIGKNDIIYNKEENSIVFQRKILEILELYKNNPDEIYTKFSQYGNTNNRSNIINHFDLMIMKQNYSSQENKIKDLNRKLTRKDQEIQTQQEEIQTKEEVINAILYDNEELTRTTNKQQLIIEKYRKKEYLHLIKENKPKGTEFEINFIRKREIYEINLDEYEEEEYTEIPRIILNEETEEMRIEKIRIRIDEIRRNEIITITQGSYIPEQYEIIIYDKKLNDEEEEHYPVIINE